MTRRPRFGVLAVLALLAGCSVGPDYQAPVPPDGATGPLAALDPAVATSGPGEDAWWRLYDDPALDRLIAEAFAANAELRAAEANLGAARAVFEAARAQRYPTTGIGAGAVYGRDPMTDEILEIGGHKPFSDWTDDALVDVAYEVDLFGRVRRSIEAARAGSEAVAAQRDGLKVTIAAETARAYAQICTLGEQLDVAHHAVALAIDEERITTARHEAGGASDLDVARARGQVAEVQAVLPPLEGQRRAAGFQLAALLGRTPTAGPGDLDTCRTPPRLAALIPAGDGAALLRRRPDIRAADRQLAASVAQIGVATAELYPRVSLSGFWGGVSDKVDLLATENALAWGVGPSIAWSFPNQAGPRARIRQAEAKEAAALAGFDAAVLQALKETAQALSTYAAEGQHRAALGEVRRRQARSFELAQNRYAAGAASHLDLLTAEQALVAAEAAVAASDGAIVQDQIAVFKALGGGWQSAQPSP